MELEWGLIRSCFNAHGSVEAACICTWPFRLVRTIHLIVGASLMPTTPYQSRPRV